MQNGYDTRLGLDRSRAALWESPRGKNRGGAHERDRVCRRCEEIPRPTFHRDDAVSGHDRQFTPTARRFRSPVRRSPGNFIWLCGYDVAGLFAAGGAGEFFSLTPAEVAQVVAVAVDETKGRVPVLAGTGYGTAIAREIAMAAEKAGADGLLLLPPYLAHSEQDGLAAHVEAVCAATRLGVIVYNRDMPSFSPTRLRACATPARTSSATRTASATSS
jgi:hypothetical protein